jgi:hypothetical protein
LLGQLSSTYSDQDENILFDDVLNNFFDEFFPVIFFLLFPYWISFVLMSLVFLAFRFLSEYRFDISKLEPLVAKVGDFDSCQKEDFLLYFPDVRKMGHYRYCGSHT